MKKRLKNILALIVAVITIIVCFAFSTQAYIDWGNAVYISYAGQVVDSITYNGKTVNAVYAPRNQISNYDSNTTYCCAAFVQRFYSTVFGVGVNNLFPGYTPNVYSGGGYFYKVSTPQVGDIAASSGHWAIVKAVSGNTVTLIEQNTWNLEYTAAQVNRKLTLPESSYWFWRWSGNSGGTVTPSYFTALWHSDVTNDNAKINATINMTYLEGCGFYLGTSTNNMKRVAEPTNANVINIWFDLKNECGITLTPGTKYYYKIFIVVGGKEYASATQSFTTAGQHSHEYTLTSTKTATCTTDGEKKYTCTCGATKTEKINKLGHSVNKTTTTKATLSKDGSVSGICTRCYSVIRSTVYMPKTFTLSATNYVYDGKVKAPAVTVKDSAGKTLRNGTDYTVAYSGARKAIGKYTVNVTFKGNYTGAKQLSFTISTKAPSKVTATQSTNAIKLTWDKVSGATGYRIYYKSGSTWKVAVSATTATSHTFKNLKAGTKFVFAVRPYTISGGNTIWSPYTECATATKTVKIAKITAKQTTSKVTLSWPKVAGATAYRIYYKAGDSWKIIVDSTTATSCVFTFSTAGAKCTFAVRPYIKSGNNYIWSDYTTCVAATTPATVTAKVSSPAKGKITLNWNQVTGADGYQVYYKTGNGSYKLYKTVGKNVKSLSFANLKSGTKYTFAVRAGIKTTGGNIFGGYKAATVTVK